MAWLLQEGFTMPGACVSQTGYRSVRGIGQPYQVAGEWRVALGDVPGQMVIGNEHLGHSDSRQRALAE